MQFLTYKTDGGEKVGLHVQGTVYDIQACLEAAGADLGVSVPGALPDLKGMIGAWDRWESPLRTLEEKLDAFRDRIADSARQPADEIAFLPPIPRPGKNPVMLGRNYQAHADEGARVYGPEIGDSIIEHPIYFTKAATSLIGHRAGVIHHAVTKELDYEVELAVVMGRGGRAIPPEKVLDHVFGYTVCNDVSARDLQHRHNQWFLGKSLDASFPIGPWIVTKDEIPNPHSLNVACRVNGEARQDANTSDLIFDIPTCVSVFSQGVSFEAADILATGTPEGCGFGLDPPRFLKLGDVVECEVEGVGRLVNPVVAPSA
ncbi:MAG: fumarylacetoacetate hydrolase family protein [Nitrospinota bacterium]|nr:fumarylacetoacetate hydrolase family protein [Nitrospinota bacterium]